ncbi:FxsB family cyclophane-forming radical SAM/SPASM peptide maturase [Actinoplanes regularis]|uniref:Radical SAM core domain-containing protein n=1 Tax=Actinoplanes regularis TaxID=52697 RepID=A0A239B9P7_9ACTN|nr:FxsB family cyclophane-forming radical SAM/SPASM peptide maturase [Actinoplanes regularis]GIE87815.1 hypothetical protein Are01nite_42950 [Actinoplanes regularis]SNS03924.1 uncharacterized protein SAMN06264365_10920 [Actinoplanes regularis]
MFRASGAGPPIGQYILKVHGRCDLACDHCYVYQSVDQSWRDKPRSMSSPVLRAAARRVAEHAAARGLSRVRVVLHGGEPLLVGVERMRELLACLRSTIEPVAGLDLIMQTNAVRLDAPMCEVLKEHGVRVGVSLDGDREANDRHRRFANGDGSFDRVRAALALLRTPAYRELYAGLLCTIDLANDPELVYEALLAELPPRVDFLLPHATWQHPPPRPGDDPTPYATWLSAIHRRWLADRRPMRIRLFEALESTARGGPSGSEQLGADSVDLVVIETDGHYEQVDTIKTAYPGAPRTGLTVLTHPVDDVAVLAPVAARQTGIDGLSPTCRTCPVVTQCGGGLYAHRYRPGTGFDNPSVYCADLRVLIDRTNEENRMHAENGKPEDTGAVPTAVIHQIASGFGDAETIGWLAEQELAITRALLFAVVDQHGANAAWEILGNVEAMAPDAVREVLAHPYVRPWAVERLRGGGVSYLGALAAASAVRAGIPVEVEVEAVDGVVHLPEVGTVHLPIGATGPARLRFDGAALRLTRSGEEIVADLSRHAPTESWQPVRRVALADGWTVRIEDGDPARACHRWPLTGRLRDDEERDWRSALAEAWQLIRAEVPGYAPALRTALRTVVPLRADESGAQRASTARHAFGSVAAALAEPADLAVLLVHEFQHGKLGALLDLCDLFDLNSDARMMVGWRPDPRPVEGVLQGVYAHAAVADLHRVRLGRDEHAEQVYAKYHRWTVDAIDGLRATGGLTPLGEDFVDRLAATVQAWDS